MTAGLFFYLAALLWIPAQEFVSYSSVKRISELVYRFQKQCFCSSVCVMLLSTRSDLSSLRGVAKRLLKNIF